MMNTSNRSKLLRPLMATAAVSEKIRSLASLLKGNLSDDVVTKLHKELISCAEELEAELIDSTLNVHKEPLLLRSDCLLHLRSVFVLRKSTKTRRNMSKRRQRRPKRMRNWRKSINPQRLRNFGPSSNRRSRKMTLTLSRT